MPKFKVKATRHQTFYMVVDAEDEGQAIEDAGAVAVQEAFSCAPCSGWGQKWNIGESDWDEWEVESA